MPCEVGKLKCIFKSSSLSIISIDLTPLKPERPVGTWPTKNGFPVCQAIWTFQLHHWNDVSPKNSGSFSRLCVFRLVTLPFSFHFLKVRVSSWKGIKKHVYCEMSSLTLNFPVQSFRWRHHWVLQWLSDFDSPSKSWKVVVYCLKFVCPCPASYTMIVYEKYL
jgi:hypothetical protein